MHSGRRTIGALVATLVLLLGLTSATSVSAAAKKPAKKSAKKKTTKKKTTKKVITRVIDSPSSSTAAGGKARPANVDPDGTLAIGFAAAANSLDPIARPTPLTTYLSPLYDRLTNIDANLNVQPMLATSWRFPDRSTMELTLRTNATFEDGTKFDAAAVKANIERDKQPSSGLFSQLSGVSSVEVVRPDLVRFHLSSGGTELPGLLATQAGMMMSPKVIASGVKLDNGTHGAGSGPYTVSSFVPGDKITYKQSSLVTSGSYWDKGAGLLKQMSIQYIVQNIQRINAVRSGDLDLGFVTGSDVATAAKAIKDGTVQGITVDVPLTEAVFQMRQTRPPFDNLQFRQAMEYGINKELFNQAIYEGQCAPSNIFWTPSHWSYSKSADSIYHFDHDKAQQLVKQSGIFNPTFTMGYSAIFAQQAQVIQGMLGDYGINVKLELLPTGDTRFQTGQLDALYGAATAPGVDPLGYIKAFYLGTSGLGLYNDADASVTKALAQASDPSTPQVTAKALYDTIYTKLANQAVQVDLCHIRQAYVHAGKVANISDVGFKFSGLPDFRYLYVKK